MIFSSLPTRRGVLARSLIAGALLSCAPARAWASRQSKASEQHDLFDDLMVRGPFPVKTANPLSFALPGQNRDLPVRVSYPDPALSFEGGLFPVVLFSHGELSSKDLYIPIADHWASHGIVVILPTHLDSQSLGYAAGQLDNSQVLKSRVGDLTFLLDHLDMIAAEAPALSGRLNKDRVGIGGHGFGSLVGLAMAGLAFRQPDGQMVSRSDDRVKAIISYNGVGPSSFLADGWTNITVPTFAATGTNDPGSTADNALLPWRWRLSPYSLTAGKERYGVSIALADHSYGGLIYDPTPGGKPDATALAIVNAMSTAFVLAHFTNDKKAEHFLKTVDLSAFTDGRGFLERA